MKNLILITALLCLFVAQICIGQIKPLTVGDKFPDIELNNLIRYSKSKLKISDFKEKLVILDFWSPGCPECIMEMPKMGKLQKQFGDQIKILPIWSAPGKHASKKWLKFADSVWNNNPDLYKASKLPTILDTTLYPYVKHLPGVAFQLWIDGKGIIRGITTFDYVNEKEITGMLKGEIPNWRIFKKIEYDYDKPLVRIASNPEALNKIFYSVASKHKEYISPRIIQEVDSAKGIRRFLGANLFIKDLYSICYQNLGQPAYESAFRVETRDSSRFYKVGRYFEEWWANDTYFFEKIAPIDMPDSIFYLSMKEELDNQFGIRSLIEKRKVDCLVLKRNDDGTKSNDGKPSEQESLKQLLNELNTNVLGGKKMILADKSLQAEKNQGYISPKVSNYEDFKNISKVNTALKRVGLRLEESTEVASVIVLKDLYSK